MGCFSGEWCLENLFQNDREETLEPAGKEKVGQTDGAHCHSCPAAAESLQSGPTLCDPRRQPPRLPRPCDSPGKNAGVGAISFSNA